jgi:hypothetical protein
MRARPQPRDRDGGASLLVVIAAVALAACGFPQSLDPEDPAATITALGPWSLVNKQFHGDTARVGVRDTLYMWLAATTREGKKVAIPITTSLSDSAMLVPLASSIDDCRTGNCAYRAASAGVVTIAASTAGGHTASGAAVTWRGVVIVAARSP